MRTGKGSRSTARSHLRLEEGDSLVLAWKRAEARRTAAALTSELRVLVAEVQRLSERVASLTERLDALAEIAH